MIKQIEQVYKTLQSHQKVLQTSLLFLSISILVFCKQISGYLSNYNVDYWFDYFITVERLAMLLLLLSVSTYLKERCWLIYELLLFFLIQDFLDRVIFDITCWHINDTIAIGIILIQLLIRIKKKNNDSK